MTICAICKRQFKDNSGLGNHLKFHPEYIKSLKQIVIDLFDSNLTADEILKNKSIPLRARWIGIVWMEHFGKEAVKARVSRIYSQSMHRRKASGEKNWNEGKINIAPELIVKIEKLFSSNDPIEKISEDLDVSEGPIRKIWLQTRTKKDLNERFKRINKHQYITGQRKIWCDGKTSLTDKRVNALGNKTRLTKLKKNKSNGIYTDSSLRRSIAKSEFNKNRKIIINKYNSTCQICGKDHSNSIHHIIPYRISKSNALSNLTCLCKPCHASLHGIIRQQELGGMSFEQKCDLYINGLINA